MNTAPGVILLHKADIKWLAFVAFHIGLYQLKSIHPYGTLNPTHSECRYQMQLSK